MEGQEISPRLVNIAATGFSFFFYSKKIFFKLKIVIILLYISPFWNITGPIF